MSRLWIILCVLSFAPGLYAQCNLGQTIGEWNALAPMLLPRLQTSAGVIDGKIYVIGDYNYSPDNGRLSVYDPTLDSWTELAPLINPRGMGAAAVHDGLLYSFGGNGCFSNCWHTYNEVYDPSTNTWAPRAPIPDDGRGVLTAHTVGDRIYLMGGANSYVGAYDDVWIYDPIADTWSAGTPLPQARSHHASAVIDGKIYLLGGNDDPAPIDSCDPPILRVDIYDPAADAAGLNPWSTAADLPFLRRRGEAVTLNGRIYLLGGRELTEVSCGGAAPTTLQVGDFLADVHEYDPVLDCWREVASLPSPRADFAAVTLDGAIYVMGGVQDGGVPTALADVDRFTLGPAFRLILEEAVVEHDDDLLPTGGTVGITLEETSGGNAIPVDGVEMRFLFDDSVLALDAATAGSDLAAVCGGAGPDFFQVTQCDNVVTAGIVVSTMGACSLLVSGAAEVMSLEFSVVTPPATGTTTLTWENGTGCNSLPLMNEVSVGSVAYSPELIDGSMTFVPVEFFRRGDCNQDVAFGVADAVFSAQHLFVPGSDSPGCAAACDANGDGGFDITDVVFSLHALFVPGSPHPPLPFPDCGPESVATSLSCPDYAACP